MVHPEWEKLVDALLGFGQGSRFISIGMNQQLPKQVDLHRVTPQSAAWMNRSSYRFSRETADTHYCLHFAGIRLWFHKGPGTYLPYPPEREDGADGASKRRQPYPPEKGETLADG